MILPITYSAKAQMNEQKKKKEKEAESLSFYVFYGLMFIFCVYVL